MFIYFFARKGVDIKMAKLLKGPHRKGNYNQAPLQPDYAGAVDEPVTHRSPLLADALDRSNPRAKREVSDQRSLRTYTHGSRRRRRTAQHRLPSLDLQPPESPSLDLRHGGTVHGLSIEQRARRKELVHRGAPPELRRRRGDQHLQKADPVVPPPP